jgi:hypothetical protein
LTISTLLEGLDATGKVIDKGAYRAINIQAYLGYWLQLAEGTTTVYLGASAFASFSVYCNPVASDLRGNPPGGYRFTISSANQHVRRSIAANKAGGAYKAGTVTKGGGAYRGGYVAKAGQAYKQGTVYVQGTSSADTVLGKITVDVQGLADDANGTITGTPGYFIELPGWHTKLLLREVYKETNPALYDNPSWQAALNQQWANGYRWGWTFKGGSFREWRKQVGYQGRAELYQEGGLWRYTWRDKADVQYYFTDRNLADDIVLDWSPRTELATELDVTYDPTEDGTWQQKLTLTSTVSNHRYGLQRGRRDLGGRALALPWVRDSGTATRLGTYWLSQWETERLRPTIKAFWDAIGLEKTDTIQVTTPLLTSYGTTRFRIRQKSYDLEAGLLTFECEEADIPPQELLQNGAYRLKSSSSSQLTGQTRCLRIPALIQASRATIRLAQVRTPAGRYLMNLQPAPSLLARMSLFRAGQESSLPGALRLALTRITTLTGGLAFQQGRTRTLTAVYGMSGATFSVARPGTYRLRTIVAPGQVGRYTLRSPASLILTGIYGFSTLAVNKLKSGRYAVRSQNVSPTWIGRYVIPHPVSLALGGLYTVPPRRVLSATYLIKSAWDAAGATWDSAGRTWDESR